VLPSPEPHLGEAGTRPRAITTTGNAPTGPSPTARVAPNGRPAAELLPHAGRTRDSRRGLRARSGPGTAGADLRARAGREGQPARASGAGLPGIGVSALPPGTGSWTDRLPLGENTF